MQHSLSYHKSTKKITNEKKQSDSIHSVFHLVSPATISTPFAGLLDLLHVVLAWMVKSKKASMASVTTIWKAASYAASFASSSVVILGKSSIVAVEAVAIVGSLFRGIEGEL